MRKTIIALGLALSSPAYATGCFIAPSWDLGETVVTLHGSPGGYVSGYLPPDVPVVVRGTAYPWAFISSWNYCCGEISGWVWLRSVPDACLPPPQYVCDHGCDIYQQPVRPRRHTYVQPQPYFHEKGQYQEQPHVEEKLPDAPPPENQNGDHSYLPKYN